MLAYGYRALPGQHASVTGPTRPKKYIWYRPGCKKFAIFRVPLLFVCFRLTFIAIYVVLICLQGGRVLKSRFFFQSSQTLSTWRGWLGGASSAPSPLLRLGADLSYKKVFEMYAKRAYYGKSMLVPPTTLDYDNLWNMHDIFYNISTSVPFSLK